jgi:dihydrofolate reductase
MNKPLISAVVAIGAKDRSIGASNRLLWHILEDMKRFRDITMGHPVVMGRKTYESLPDKFRPLPGRENIIITRDADYTAPGARVTHSLEEAMKLAKTLDDEEIFIGGGQQIYEQALPQIDKLYLTIVESDKTGDTFFPAYEDQFPKETFREEREHDGLKYTWINLER